VKITVDTLARAALALSVDDREELMCRIVASLWPPPGVWSADDPGLADELERRLSDYDSGIDPGIDGAEAIRRIRRELLR
jgi:putative addiction module component (TIGR02574 family)